MATIYYKLIKAGKKVIEEVPENLREEVRNMLKSDALGKP